MITSAWRFRTSLRAGRSTSARWLHLGGGGSVSPRDARGRRARQTAAAGCGSPTTRTTTGPTRQRAGSRAIRAVPRTRPRRSGPDTDYVSFFLDRGMPRLRYRCTLPQTRDCHKDQYINSAHDYKRLLPIWETHKNYAILREAHPEYERIHNHNRHRYRISPDCLELRPKRIGAAWQQLRVSATVIEWLRVCFHQGWIGKSGHQNPPNAPPNASSSKPAELANASADAAAGSPNADPAPAPHHPGSPPPSRYIATSPSGLAAACLPTAVTPHLAARGHPPTPARPNQARPRRRRAFPATTLELAPEHSFMGGAGFERA